MTRPLERDIQADIREALGLEPGLVLWRNSVGETTEWDARTHTRRTIRYGLAVGSADLVGILTVRATLGGYEVDLGRLFALEVKRPGEYPTPDQRRWASLVRSLAGFVATVRSVDDARGAVARARAGANE